MGLSRLDNFLKNVRGNILYVNPNDLDSTDSIENQGNSLTRPFKTIQRALIEASRFSYQRGLNNDRFGQTTILVYPGDHIIDNRPGWIPTGSNTFKLRSGADSSDFPSFDLTTNFDLTSSENALYKLNSVYGGVIIPRGTSIVGLDLRKTKIRPKYAPDPTNDSIETSAIFRVTGSCYFWQFSIFDCDPNSTCYIDYTNNPFVPNFSHHKLTGFEYADGVNEVKINDAFITNYNSGRTDLDMYYEKVGLAYGQSTGRAIEPDYPDPNLDIQPKIDEYRIVGSTGANVGISSIKAGDGSIPTTTITVTTNSALSGLDVDTPFRIDGITAEGYDGQFVVSDRLSDTVLQYKVQNAPIVALPSVTGSVLTLNSDTVTSASPYIFNVSLRSVYGMCGLHADGNRATGFKSMVVAQYTGIGLQKDDNAFVIYDNATGTYQDSTVPGNQNLSSNSRSVFKPSYANYHIKASNDAFIQNVSVFAIGFAEHFVAESGGDMSITNSNSNFGAKALVARGYRKNAFPQDDVGYVTHIIPPKEITTTATSIEFNAIDVATTVGIATTTERLYLYNQKNSDVSPENVVDGYRVGAKENDTLNVLISVGGSVTQYSSRIVMQNSQTSSEKVFYINRSPGGINSITSNVATLTTPHTFASGESIRILSDTGQLPDGLVPNTVYYAITSDSGITTNTQLKIAKTRNDAISGTEIEINEKGGTLKIVSRVSDKLSGDIGHPIQYDSSVGQWYVKVATATTENTIYSSILGLGVTALGSATPRTFINRQPDNRSSIDTIYRLRYVIPAASGVPVSRPITDGFILQESNTSIGATTAEIQTYFGTEALSNVNQQRNFRFIANANWASNSANILTELPHNLSVGSQVELNNIVSSSNPNGIGNSGYNGIFNVTGITSSKEFVVGIATAPGTFTNNTNVRNTSLPYYKRKRFQNTYFIYRNEEVQKYLPGSQDGIYYLTVVNASNSPTVAPFLGQKFSQPVKELYPQTNRDNPSSDPTETQCFANSSLIGQVYVNDVRKSITKETVTKILKDSDVGVGITNFISVNSSGAASTHTIYTAVDHGFNRIVQVSIANSGFGYGNGIAGDFYNAKLVSIGASTTGKNATAKITIDSFGGITNIRIMDGGSAYGIGNSLAVVGVATTALFSQAVVNVTKIYNNIGDTVRVTGISSDSNQKFNTIYRITDIPVGSTNEIQVSSASTIYEISGLGIGATLTSNAVVYGLGPSLNVSSINYNNTIGIATVTTTTAHGLRVDTKVRLGGSDQPFYNGSFIVKENVGLSTFTVYVGTAATAPTFSGTVYAYREGVTSNGGVSNIENESLNGRMVPTYAGITTSLSSNISTPTTEQVSITNINNVDILVGDYLQIDDEIVRVKQISLSSPSGSTPSFAVNPIFVFRGILGTKATTHDINSIVRKIQVHPIELRRHSINRASAHTFEYLGYGPGNYSTAFPDKQDRAISPEEELLSQSTRQEGGINFYTGMNDRGISYSGNRKLSTVTGQEEVFDTPIRTVTGEDFGNSPSINIIDPAQASFSRSIIVDGGSDGKAISQFNGPVIFSNKLTSISDKGIEANLLYLQGDSVVSRKYTVGIATPTIAGNPGDVVYYENPNRGGYLGWVYTAENDWYRFGPISLDRLTNIGIFDKVGVGTTSPQDCTLRVGAGNSLFCVDGSGVGIGTSANLFKLNVEGNTNIAGTCYAISFSGNGSGLTNLAVEASGWRNVASGLGTGIYNTYLTNVGVGTTIPKYNLELGSPGSATTALYVNSKAIFAGFTTTADITIGGIITATNYRLDSTSSNIRAGIVTTSTLVVGTSGTVITTDSLQQIGIGTVNPRAKLDIEGSVKFKTYSEQVSALSISANNVNVDLSQAQTFTLTVTSAVNQITIFNCPSGSTSFNILVTQGSTAYAVAGISTYFKNNVGGNVNVYWSGGGVKPIVTTIANKTDIYSFKTFDGGTSWYGVVGGQNFAL
jgi:hypothetical protein